MNTIEVKTSELAGAALDWAAGYAARDSQSDINPYPSSREAWAIDWSRQSSYSPSTDWAQGGPLIEKYGVEIMASPLVGGFFNAIVGDEEDYDWQPGDTHLIAAMRAIVAAKLGDAVSVPSELLEQMK